MENNLENKLKEEPPDCKIYAIRLAYAEDILINFFSKNDERELIHKIFSKANDDKNYLEECRRLSIGSEKRYNTFFVGVSFPLMREMRERFYNNGFFEMEQSLVVFVKNQIEPILRAFYVEKYCDRRA